jgi:hypothetical protein
VAANNEQQKDLAALAICGNNLEAIDVLQRLHQYCLNIGDLQLLKLYPGSFDS